MTEALPPRHPLRRLFEALVQETFFAKPGVPDPRLADYLSDLLCRFVRMDAIFGMRDVRGRRLEEVAEMLALVWHRWGCDVECRSKQPDRRN